MASPDSDFDALHDALVASLRQGLSAGKPLDLLLQTTGARASGLWVLRGSTLELRDFRGVGGMLDEVKEEFAAATARVSLESPGLGIVKAALNREPVVAYLETCALEGSAGWLRRFGAAQSLALPILDGDEVVGVLAVSASEEFDSDSRTWGLLARLATAIGPDVRQALEHP